VDDCGDERRNGRHDHDRNAPRRRRLQPFAQRRRRWRLNGGFEQLAATQTPITIRSYARSAERADDVTAAHRISRHDRIRTPACPTPLLYAFESPNISTFPPTENARCWSTMNGAVARWPAIVFTSGVSLLVTALSPELA